MAGVIKGNLIQSMNPSQTVNYQYNFMNKVASITKTGLENTALTMNYNGIGHRTRKTYSDGKIYSYLYFGNNILEETSNQYIGGVAYYIMGGIDEVFARTINNSPEFYLKDNLNSLRKVIDNTQGILNTTDYEPFGSVLSGDAGNHNYLFTGREKDFNDVYYYRARTFSPISGRFQQIDPIGINGGLNLYTYCGNNPVNYMDPLGLALTNNTGEDGDFKHEDPSQTGGTNYFTSGNGSSSGDIPIDGGLFGTTIVKTNPGVDMTVHKDNTTGEIYATHDTYKDFLKDFAGNTIKNALSILGIDMLPSGIYDYNTFIIDHPDWRK